MTLTTCSVQLSFDPITQRANVGESQLLAFVVTKLIIVLDCLVLGIQSLTGQLTSMSVGITI